MPTDDDSLQDLTFDRGSGQAQDTIPGLAPIHPALAAPAPPIPSFIGAGKGMVPAGGVRASSPTSTPDYVSQFLQQHVLPAVPAIDESQAAQQWYERYRQGDQSLPAPDWLRRIIGVPAPNPPHPDLPAYTQLAPESAQTVLQSYRQSRAQQIQGQGGVYQGFPTPVELVTRGAGESISATPGKPVLQGALEAKRQALYGLGSQTGVSYEQATDQQKQEAINSANQLLVMLGMGPATTMGLTEGLGAAIDRATMLRRQLNPLSLGQSLGAGAAEGAQGYATAAQRAETPTRLAPRPLQPAPLEMDLTRGPVGAAITDRTGTTPVQYQITGKSGRVVGDLLLSIQPDGTADIHWARAATGKDALLPGDMPRLATELQALHPEITRFANTAQAVPIPAAALPAPPTPGEATPPAATGLPGAPEALRTGVRPAEPAQTPPGVPEAAPQAAADRLAAQRGAVNTGVLGKGLAAALKPFGIGGRVQRAADIARTLSQFPPEAAQQLAFHNVTRLSGELSDIRDTGLQPIADLRQQEQTLRASGNTAGADGLAQRAEQATTDWQKAVQDKTNEIGKYEAAATDVMDGRKHPVTPWSDQIANEIHEKIGFSEKDLPPSDASGFMLARSEANMLLKKARGLQTSINNLSTGWSRALVKSLPLKADRVKVIHELEPKRVGGTATLHTPPETGEPAASGPPSEETGIEPKVPDVIQKIMDEEYQAPGNQTFHLNEQQAYAAAEQRGLWPPPEGAQSAEALAGGPPPLGTIAGHQVRAVEPPPVEITPQIREAAGAIRALLTRVGLHLVDNAHLISALRQDFYPHIFLKGPNGETAAQAMDMALNPGRRHPLNPDTPTFHRRFLEDTLPALQGQGYKLVDDPAVVVPAYLRSVARALANQMVTTYIKGAIVRPGQDGRPAFVPGEQGRLPETGFDLKGYKFLNTDELKGYLHPDVYNALRWQLESAVVKNPALKALLKFQQFDRQVVMFNPLFHGENQLSHHLMTSAVPGRLALLGRAMSQDPAIVRDAAQWAHLTPAHSAMDDMVDVVHGVMPEVRDPLSLGNLSSIPGRVNDWRHQVLWEGMVRNAQIAAFVLERERLMQQGFTREDASAGAGVYADRIVGAQDPATKLAWERVGSRYFMFAYNWTKTHVMQVAESLPLGLGQRVLVRENPFLSPEVASQLSSDLLISSLRGVSSALVYTQMLNLILTGMNGDPHLTFFNEKGREWQLDTTGIAKLMGIPTGGKNIYLGSPFMRFPDWYRQYIEDIQRANGGRGAMGSGSLEFFKNKLMAPFPQVWDQIANAESGGHQWSDWERVRNLLLGLGTQQGILPTTIVGTPATIGAAARELLPHGAVDLMDPAGVWGRIVHPGVQVGRQELGLLSRALGGQPPSYGPRPDVGQVLDPKQERSVDLYLASNGISPVKATVQQRNEAITAVGNNPLDNSAGQEQAFKDTEKQAVLDMMRQHPEHLNGQTPEAAYQAALDQGRSPFDELNNLQKAEIFKQHPELELFHQVASGAADPAQRETLRQSTAYRVALQDQIDQERKLQNQDDQLFQQGQLTEQAWRDRRSRRMQELYGQNGAVPALKDAYPQALITTQDWNNYYQQHGQAPKGLTPEDTAYEQYRAINLDDPKYQLPDGSPDVIRWWQDRQQVLRGLPPDQQDYIHVKESANRTPLENLYEQAVQKYLAFEAQHAPGAAAYHQLYQTTSSLQEQKLLRAGDPQLQNYIIQRRLFLLQNPAVAFFVSGGRTVGRDLLAAGVSPLTNSAQQLQQLQQGGFVGQELGATNPDLFAGQVGSLTPGG